MKTVIIKSSILSRFAEVVHGISTKVGSMNDLNFNLGYFSHGDKEKIHKNRKIFFNELGIDENSVVYQQQIHSDQFKVVSKAGLIKQNDALITNSRNLFLVVTIADCIPILFYDNYNKITGVIHSGWRGTQSQIVFKTLDFAIQELNLQRDKTYFYFGPSICKNCFEVDEDVAQQFESKYLIKKNLKFTIDLPKINMNYLLKLGFRIENIQISKLCTFELKNLLHSYRRDKDKSGRMFGVIGIK